MERKLRVALEKSLKEAREEGLAMQAEFDSVRLKS